MRRDEISLGQLKFQLCNCASCERADLGHLGVSAHLTRRMPVRALLLLAILSSSCSLPMPKWTHKKRKVTDAPGPSAGSIALEDAECDSAMGQAGVADAASDAAPATCAGSITQDGAAVAARALTLVERLQANVARLSERLASMLSPTLPIGGFNMAAGHNSTERQRAIDYVWSLEYDDAASELLRENPGLCDELEQRTAGTYDRSSCDDESAMYAKKARREKRNNYLAGLLARNRSQYFLPKHQLLLALECKHKVLNHELWAEFSSLRVIPSYNWTDSFVDDCLLQNPGCPYQILDGVSAVVFDNYTEQVNYQATHNSDTQGVRLDMTNWATVYLPLDSMPQVDLHRLLRKAANVRAATFKPGFDKHSIIPLCHPAHPEISGNKSRRWRDAFLDIQAGTYFNRPSYHPPLAHSFYFHDPIEGRLQSSYEDVEAELNIFRQHPKHCHSNWIFVGGDGLSINRLNHCLARHPGKYIERTPVVIPVQGEHPHGSCHILHMGWRPYSPLLVPLFTAIGHSECKPDFTVSSFKNYDHAMCILIEGVAQYLILLSQSDGAPNLANGPAFIRACQHNIDLSWLTHFLFDFGFLYWDFRQSVRANNGSMIDLIWRECISFMHSDTSHKTQYAPMAILRIFWAEALTPALARIYQRNRTFSLCGLNGSNVGWDMVIEKENRMISVNVVRASFERIVHYVRQLNLLGPVSRALAKVFRLHRQRKPAVIASIKSDVDKVVNHLQDKLGSTWQDANVAREQRGSKIIQPPRSPKPWERVEHCLDGLAEWMKQHIDSKVSWM